jgi:hypothetical protein
MTFFRLVAALGIALVAVLLQVAAFSAPAHAAAGATQAKKQGVKQLPAPQNCVQAIKAVNAALRARAIPRYRLKTAKGAQQRRVWKKKVKQADKRVNAARAALKVQCQGSGTTSALDADCAISITTLDKLIGLEYERKMKLKKVKGNSKKARAKRKAMRKRLKKVGDQIKAQTSTFASSCSNGGGNGGGNGGAKDTTAPGAPTVKGPNGKTNDDTPAITVTTTEPGGTIQCRIDDGAWQTAEASFEIPADQALSDGTHLIECRQIDDAGNAGEPGGATVVVDTHAPGAVTISGPGTTNDTTPTFTITPPAGETGGHIECRIDGGEWVTVESPWTTPELTEGTHTITCRYVDEAGNAGAETSVEVKIDKTAPTGGPTIEVPGSGPGGENNGQNPTVNVTPPAGETGGHIECKISGNGYDGEFANFTTVPSAWVLPTLPEGTYTITCHYVDAAGNPGPDTEYTLVIDRTAPGAPTVAGPTGPTTDDTPAITVTTTEPGGTIRCRVDGGEWQTASASFDAPQLDDGVHTIDCTQTDAAGNTSAIGSTTVNIDTTAPGKVTISGPSGATSDTTPSFNLSGAAPGDKYECSTDGGAFATTGNVYTTAALTDGVHSVTCHLVDAAGNTGENSSASVTIDTHAPGSVTISGPAVTNNPTPTITITSSETGGHIECKLDDGAFQTVTSPWTLPALADGTHTVKCHYVTGAGVNGPDSTYTVVIDTVAPSAVTMTGPSGLINTNKPSYTLGGGVGGSFQCNVDGGAWSAASSPYTTPALSEGAHTVNCRAIDAAGNTTAPVAKSVTVDTVAPTLTLADGAVRWDGRHNFSFTTNEASTVKCKIDNGTYATTTSPFTTDVLSNGSHTLTCIATDTAGNATIPVVKPFGVFRDPVTVSKTGGFQWGLACTGNATLNSWLGCPDDGLSITIPANPNGLTGNYLVDLTGKINGLCNLAGIGSTYTMHILVDGASKASDSETAIIDLLCLNRKNLAASVTSLSLSASTSHTIQLSLKSSAFLSVLPSVASSSLTASIHH